MKYFVRVMYTEDPVSEKNPVNQEAQSVELGVRS